MTHNWITWIGVLLVVTPILFALVKGLPSGLEQMTYSVLSAVRSVHWIVAFGLALWFLRTFIMQNTLGIEQVSIVQQLLKEHMLAWVVAIPLVTSVFYGILGLVIAPIASLLVGAMSGLQNWASKLPGGVSRLLAVVLQIPRALLRLALFALVLHLALPYVHAPKITQMASESPLYQWADNSVVEPVLASDFVKRLPVLGDNANNWFHELGQEAVKNGPAGAKGYITWETRFDSNAEIDAQARQIVAGATTDREKAERLYEWIGSHIRYDDQKAAMIEAHQFGPLAFGAVPTYETRKGVCSDYSSLMVAMGRAVNLKVKQEFGMGLTPDGGGGPHAWNVVYLPEQQKWIPCDPTWEQAGNYFDNPDFYQSHKPEQQAG